MKIEAMGNVATAGGALERRLEMADEWVGALARWERSSQELVRAYQALEKQVRRLDLALEARNRELEESLKERQRLQELLTHILEGLPVGVLVWDLQERLVWINQQARALFGEVPHGQGVCLDAVLLTALPPSSVQLVKTSVRQGRSQTLEGSVAGEGREARRLRLHATSLSQTAGQKLGGLLTIEDLTEIRAMEEEMARSQRLAAMGEMAASLAHEVRNPLGSIHLLASLMAEEPSQGARQAIAEQIQAAIRSVDQLLKNLLIFARPLRPRPRLLDPIEILSDCLGFVEPLARQKKVRLLVDRSDPAPRLQADPELLKQALLNVILNSFQAMPQGGTVRAWVCYEDGMDSNGPGEGWVEINVEDSGVGIPPEVLPRIFDPFFTTRSEGSGLGLSIVHNILRSHGGSVRIQSAPSKGTRVRLRLPCGTLGNALERGAHGASIYPGGGR